MSDLGYPQINSLKKVYEYDPSENLTAEEEKLVLGVQANQWTALTQELKEMNVHNFPRLLALAEIAWASPKNKDFKIFSQRLEQQYPRLDSMRIGDSSGIKCQYDTISYDVTKKSICQW